MTTRFPSLSLIATFVLFGGTACQNAQANQRTALPDAAGAAPVSTTAGVDSVIFAGGCFWGIEAVFERVKGVLDATSGYAGGTTSNPSYEMVSDGNTGHAEAVKIRFDPAAVSYAQLLKVFFSVAHDPTQLNFQGPDHGTQYRSAIYFASPQQEKETRGYIAQLTQARVFSNPIVTEVAPWQRFWPAEAYHQGYYDLHPDQPYILYNDRPKVAALQKQFPALYHER